MQPIICFNTLHKKKMLQNPPVGKLCVSAVKMTCRTSSVFLNFDAAVVSEGKRMSTLYPLIPLLTTHSKPSSDKREVTVINFKGCYRHIICNDYIHRVPKLATPLASNTLNLV